MNIHFGKRIKELSETKNLSVKELSQMTGKTTQSIYDIFRKEDLGTDVLKQFADALKIPIVHFFLESPSSLHTESGKPKERVNSIVENTSVHFNSVGDCEKELDKALAIIQQMELRIKDKDEMISLLKEKSN